MPEDNIDIDPERQREIEALEAKMASSNHYEFLGVAAGAPADEIRIAFHALSRKFHPDRYFGKNLGTFKARLDKVFKRIIEANQTLSDPEKLKAYLEGNPFVRAKVKAAGPREVPAAEKSADELSRDAERRARLAKHPYLAKTGRVTESLVRARAHIAKGEYSHAFTQLNMAANADATNAEVKMLLIDVRKKNDELRSETDFKRGKEAEERGEIELAINAYKNASNANHSNHQAAFNAAALIERVRNDSKEASSFAQRAVEGDPNNVEYRLMLARVLEAAGMKAMAKKHFDEAVKLAPEHPEVKKYAKRRWPF